MPFSLRLIVFDLDGTLIDSSQDLCEGVNAALAHVGLTALPQDQIASYIGDGAATLVHRALGEADTGQTFDLAYRSFLDFYREHKLDHTLPYPGVPETLTAIHAAEPSMLMAVLTNKPVRPSRDICAALGLAPFFFQNYGGNSFATKKPAPEGLLQLMAEASAKLKQPIGPAEVAMVGDSETDVNTARAIGARAVGCSYGLSPESLAQARPDVLVSSPWDWLGALGLKR